MAVEIDNKALKKLNYFRYRLQSGRYFITNDWGGYLWLEKKEFNDLINDKLDKKGSVYKSLAANNFIKEEMDLTAAIEKYRKRKDFLFAGPSLHIMVVTLRCNHRCVYCHASAQDMKAKQLDMTRETANRALELIFKTTNPFVIIEFQGGEPTVNWPIVRFITEEAWRLSKTAKKNLELRLVTNMSLMDEEKYQFLIKNKVELCTSLDGPKHLHNQN
ncbi:MAG: radical SAM protein, partial [Planctomycetes bacterium]|nr:radical SAM protein [Planctomycetota bacterium]